MSFLTLKSCVSVTFVPYRACALFAVVNLKNKLTSKSSWLDSVTSCLPGHLQQKPFGFWLQKSSFKCMPLIRDALGVSWIPDTISQDCLTQWIILNMYYSIETLDNYFKGLCNLSFEISYSKISLWTCPLLYILQTLCILENSYKVKNTKLSSNVVKIIFSK